MPEEMVTLHRIANDPADALAVVHADAACDVHPQVASPDVHSTHQVQAKLNDGDWRVRPRQGLLCHAGDVCIADRLDLADLPLVSQDIECAKQLAHESDHLGRLLLAGELCEAAQVGLRDGSVPVLVRRQWGPRPQVPQLLDHQRRHQLVQNILRAGARRPHRLLRLESCTALVLVFMGYCCVDQCLREEQEDRLVRKRSLPTRLLRVQRGVNLVQGGNQDSQRHETQRLVKGQVVRPH
mmetsp:Transcript_109505/g.316574  ORF Transcript_109505/g.316574 Transcript_109505/m.316574 type:complete len:239 (+) Transcript_109505:280-996(+)